MSDTNWCTFCDNAIRPQSDSLYCSDDCMQQDAMQHHPLFKHAFNDLGRIRLGNGYPSHVPAQFSLVSQPVDDSSSMYLTSSASVTSHSRAMPSLSSSASSSWSFPRPKSFSFLFLSPSRIPGEDLHYSQKHC